jgi:tetratricopeptide (TPR) repeat protein
MFAAQQGNYCLSYMIYTKLLHQSQYNCQMKSEILTSRATTLLLEEKYFESIADCTQAIAYNEWNKLAYVVRAACWMIEQEYGKALDDYSRLFHLFDQSQHVLDLLNLAYERYRSSHDNNNKDSLMHIEQDRQVLVDDTVSIASILSSTHHMQWPTIALSVPSLVQSTTYRNYSPSSRSTEVDQRQNITREERFHTTLMRMFIGNINDHIYISFTC